MSNVEHLPLRPIPTTAAALLADRKTRAKPSLNKLVEQIVLVLWQEQDFHALFQAGYDEDAVEGSRRYDRMRAVEMIRDYARDHREEPGMDEVADRKLSTLGAALAAALANYPSLSTKQRQQHADVA